MEGHNSNVLCIILYFQLKHEYAVNRHIHTVLSLWSRVFLKKMIVTQLVKLLAFYGTWTSLLWSHEPVSGPHPKPDESIPYPHTLLFADIIFPSSLMHPKRPLRLMLSDPNFVCICYFSHAAYVPPPPSFSLIWLWSSSCDFLCSFVTSCLLC